MKCIGIQQPVPTLDSKAHEYNTKGAPDAQLLLGGGDTDTDGSVSDHVAQGLLFYGAKYCNRIFAASLHSSKRVREIWISTSRRFLLV